MKWMMIAVAVIGLPLVALQGVAVHKSEENYGKGVYATVQLYKAEPLNTASYLKKAVTTCLENKAQTELPAYFTNYVHDAMLMGIKFAAENDFDSTDDPAVKSYMEGETKRLHTQALELAEKVAAESEHLQNAMNATLDWMGSDHKSMARCFGPKVVYMANAS